MRRWIAAARPDSISCSQTAQASASKGSGRRRGRSHGARRITGPISGSQPEAAVELAQVVVGAEREAHPLDGAPRASRLDSASARMRTARPAAQARTSTSLIAGPDHPGERAVAPAITPSRPGARQPVRPARDDVLLDRGGYRS